MREYNSARDPDHAAKKMDNEKHASNVDWLSRARHCASFNGANVISIDL